jgi:4-amino-4-deoxy-L-arabinose transferase-like glycosyltransferase
MEHQTLRPAKGAIWTAIGSILLLLTMAPRYGFHRDEVYFIVAGRNLDWGYVDQPPFTPLIARLSEIIGGTSPFALRVLPAFAVGAIALMTSLIAKRFGGSVRAQTSAAISTGLAGVVLGEGHLLSTAIFDFMFWTAALLVLVHILDGASPRLWLLVGLLVGIGLQNKHTIAFLALAVLIGLLATRQRSLLASPWPWAGVAVAVVIALPNIIWQWNNGFPQLEMAEALRARSDGALAFVLFQPLLLSIVLAIPAAIGWWRLARSEALVPWRSLAIAYAVLFVGFLTTGGKAYYIAPMYSVLLAAGSLWFASLGKAATRWMSAATALGLAIGMVIALPLMPESAVSTVDATGELGETVGWEELVADVEVIYQSIPSGVRTTAVILTSSYGEAGAIAVMGSESGLPGTFSGHNNYYLWGPPPSHGPIIGVGSVSETMDLVCPDYIQVGVIGNKHNVENEELGLPLYLCLEPEGQLADRWDEVRHYN